MNLFQWGLFTLNSGAKSAWKIECDALSIDDWAALAEMVRQMVGPFSTVEGVPTGGLLLAQALKPYTSKLPDMPHLIVDDVLTTGGSMERLKTVSGGQFRNIMGAVIFARGPCPHWIKPLFQMPQCFWLEKPK